jgi:hypothetical protein
MSWHSYDKIRTASGNFKVCPTTSDTGSERESRFHLSENLDRTSENENFLKRIITGDETWLYGYDVETKMQFSQWVGKNSPRPKKSRWVRSNVSHVDGFLNIEGVVHHEFLRQGQTVNRCYYLEVLKRIRENVRRRKPQLWRNNSWFLHHDNAPAHASLLT